MQRIQVQQLTHTTCPYCGVGCGVTAQRDVSGSDSVQLQGDATHPANFGKLCIKGSNLDATLGLDQRLLQPMLGRQGQRRVTTWDEAMASIAQKFQQCIQDYGRDSIAFYVSGQLLTEDYYVVNKFVKGYLGTANIDTNSRLCMSSAVAGHQRAFGEDVVPASYRDFEHTDLVVLVGSNTAWCHPILYQRIMQAKAERDLKVVVIDPRFTSTCEAADLHLPILPGQDVALFNGLLQYLSAHGYTDTEFVAQQTQGIQQALQASADEADVQVVAARTGIAVHSLERFYRLFSETDKVMTLFSMGVNQSSQGVDKVNSIINCHLLTAKIGKLGCAPFSMTGQPNAMGGREVGGLANMLAAHLALDNPAHRQLVQNFWQSPHIAERVGLKAVDLFHAVEQKKIKAIWIMATNPVVSLPDADQVKRALEQCEWVVVSDVAANTDTTAYADVLLPALGWGEKDGTVTNSERRISRQRAFLTAPGQARADWWAISQLAQHMKFQGFDYQNSHEIFIEHARLSREQNAPLSQRAQTPHFRYFNLTGLCDLSFQQYQQLQPIQWPVWRKDQAADEMMHLFQQQQALQEQQCQQEQLEQEQLEQGQLQQEQSQQRQLQPGLFSHADGKARFVATVADQPRHACSVEYPLILNTGRNRDQWHSMTRTGWVAQLSTHRAEPSCEIHPQDALKYGVKAGELLQLRSAWGSCILRVALQAGIRRGQVFAPIHWSAQFSSDARVGKVVNPVVDPISAEPEFKHTPVMISAFHSTWQGVLYLHPEYQALFQALIDQSVYWSKVIHPHAIRYELAGRNALAEMSEFLQQHLSVLADEYECLALDDPSVARYHRVILQAGRVLASLYIAPLDVLPDRDWAAQLFKRQRLSAMHRKSLLAGQPIAAQDLEGTLVCSCFKVGRKRLIETIQSQQLTDEKQVTACLKAGGNCGSCLPEIRALLKSSQQA